MYVCILYWAKLLQSSLTLCNPRDCSPPGSSVHGILQARKLEWVAIPFCRGFSQPRDKPASLLSPALSGRFFTTSTTWKAIIYMESTVTYIYYHVYTEATHTNKMKYAWTTVCAHSVVSDSLRPHGL